MYWNYLERHPNHVPLPPNAEQEARDALAWFHLGENFSFRSYFGTHTISDNLRSGPRSTVPFSKQECEDLLRAISRINCKVHNLYLPMVLPHLSLSADLGDDSPGRTVFLSWILRVICTFSIWCLVCCYVFRHYHDDSLGSFRVTERYGQDTYRQWGENYAQRVPTGPLPSAPFSAYIRIPLNFTISALFFSIPNSYLEHIKVVSQYHGRLSTVQEIWDQYTSRIVKEYQDFLLIVRVVHLSSSFCEG